jgi:hypothetical protein
MFAAIDEMMARLYPTRRWGERDDEAAFRAGVAPAEGQALAGALAARLKAQATFQPGATEEWCDYVYVLCLGRPPSLLELREGMVVDDGATEEIHELYLRVALSSVARCAGVQQVAMRLERGAHGERVITESPRTGVFDPVLLKRFRTLVTVLAEMEIRHLDFGEIVEPPAGFDPGDYAARYGGPPALANYLFYPQPCSAVTTTVLPLCRRPAVA